MTIMQGEASGWGRDAAKEEGFDPSSIYRNRSWPHISIFRVAMNLARLPLRWYQGDPNGSFDELPESHELRRLWDDPNPRQSSFDVKFDIALFLRTEGEAPLALTGPGRAPLGGAPLPKEIEVVRPKFLGGAYDEGRLVGWGYNEGLRKQSFAPSDIVMIKYRDPSDDVRGLSPLLASWEALVQDRLAVLFQTAKLRNGGAVGYVLEAKESNVDLPEMKRREIRRDFDAVHGGPMRAGKLFISDRGMSLKSLDTTSRDMEYDLLRRRLREEVLGVQGVPPVEASWMETSIRANAEIQTLLLWRNTIIPDCALIENALNSPRSGLAFRYGPKIWCSFDLSGVDALQEDPNSKTDRLVSLFAIGCYSPNDVLEKLGESPDVGNPAMEQHYIAGQPVGTEADAEIVRQKKVIARARSIRRGHYWADPQRRLDASRLFDTQRDLLEAGWRGSARTLFSGQADRFLAAAGKLDPAAPAPSATAFLGMLDREKEVERAREAFGKDVRMSVAVGIRWGNKMVLRARRRRDGEESGTRAIRDEDFDLDSDALALIARIEQNLVEKVTETTWDAVRAQLAESVNAGETVAEMTVRLKEVLGERRSQYQLQRIARTETVKATNGGTLLAFRKSGVVAKKEWLSSGDERTRASHLAAEAYGPIPIEEDFLVGGSRMSFPGDPKGPIEELANCRCSLAPLVAGEED